MAKGFMEDCESGPILYETHAEPFHGGIGLWGAQKHLVSVRG